MRRARRSRTSRSTPEALFFPGGLGPMVDLAEDPLVKSAVARMYELGRVLGAVCHGPAALLDVVLSDGSSFLAGRRVAAFTVAAEEGHSLDDVPFLLDAALVRQGARHTCAAPFEPHIVVDDDLVTGQNPASAAGVAWAMIDRLRGLGELCRVEPPRADPPGEFERKPTDRRARGEDA